MIWILERLDLPHERHLALQRDDLLISIVVDGSAKETDQDPSGHEPTHLFRR